jgi:hypothetical protein
MANKIHSNPHSAHRINETPPDRLDPERSFPFQFPDDPEPDCEIPAIGWRTVTNGAADIIGFPIP